MLAPSNRYPKQPTTTEYFVRETFPSPHRSRAWLWHCERVSPALGNPMWLEGGTYHIPVDAPLLEQLGVVARLEHLALAQDEDDVGVLHRRQPVGHHHHGAALPRLLEGRLHQLLRLGVEGA